MASSINASTAGGGGVIVTSDATGNLNIQSGGSTVAAVTSAGVAVTGTLSATGAVTLTSTLGVTGAITGSSTVAGSTGILYPLTSGTAVATTSGTSIDFTGIPSWVKRITVMLSGVSLSGTSSLLIQIGAGSITATGYAAVGNAFNQASGTAGVNSTSGFPMYIALAAGAALGHMIITNVSSNIWLSSHSGTAGTATTSSITGGGNVTLSGALDRVRITTVNGTDTFDAGSVNILYE